jgi:methylmalonyl-CoA mutase
MSKLEEMKSNSFPKVSLEGWRAQAEKALKGKPVSKLNSNTYEGITRKPIYTEADLEDIQPAAAGGRADWIVSQQLYPLASLEELNEQLLLELKNGLQAVQFSVNTAIDAKALPIKNSSDFNTLLQNVSLDTVTLQIYTGAGAGALFNLLKDSTINTASLQGIIGGDPIGELVAAGKLNQTLEELYDALKKAIEWKEHRAANLKTVWIQAAPYHNGGASAVEELAAAMAAAVEYLNALMERGLTIEEAAPEITFAFPVGSDFFMEVAKLRAAKLLWRNIVEAFGGGEAAQKLTLHATTSAFTKCNLDPYVNMLRTTTESFSAAIGGAESINIDSYQQGADAFSRRIARNTHYILKEESFLSQVTDPAAGSYFVETLTHQLADEAWKLFQEIEGLGGMVKALKAGFLQEKIEQVKAKRLKDVETRKKVLVGTNMYANLKESLYKSSKQDSIKNVDNAAVKVKPIQPIRLSELYENLRYQAKSFEEDSGTQPAVTLINLGSLASHKARTDFAAGFLQVGGLYPLASPSFSKAEEVEEWLAKESISDYICICGSDSTYETMLNGVLKVLRTLDRKILLAGLPESSRQTELQNLGVTDFIHMKSNCYEQLWKIHQEMGLTQNEA